MRALASQQFKLHEPQWHYILNALKNNRLPAALLLAGPSGLGKAEFAHQLAAFLLCQQPVNHQACEHCASCLQQASNNHPDFFELAPSEKVKSISIDAIRELSDKLQRSSHQKGRQVVLINPISALTLSASHALLKTLEEPLGDVVIIAVLSEPKQILPTLRSRLVTIPFFAVEEDNTHQSKIGKALYEQSPIYLKELNHHVLDDLAVAVLNHVGKAMVPKTSALTMPKEWLKDEAITVIKILYCICKDAISIKLGLVDQCIYVNHPDKINYIAKLLPISVWYSMLEKVGQSLGDARSATAFNQQYLIENILITLQYESIRNKKC